MNMTMFKTALFFAAALFMVNCGDSSESTPAAPAETSATVPPEITAPVETTPVIPEDSVEVPSITVTDSVVDTTEYSCHDSKWIPRENFNATIMSLPELLAWRRGTYLANTTFYRILKDTVAQLHYKSNEFGLYPDSTPYCLIEMIDTIANYKSNPWANEKNYVSNDSIATEIECSDGTVHPKESDYIETLNTYKKQQERYNQVYDSIYEQSLHDIKALLDSCLNYPENFPPTDPDYETRYQSYWLTHDEFEDDDE